MSHGEPVGPETLESPISALRGLAGPDYASTLTSTPPSGSGSGGQGNSSPRSADQADSSSEVGRMRVLKELEGSVESFRGGRVPKTEAIASVLRILENADIPLTQSQKDATFDSYLTEILSIQSSFDESRGTTRPR